jgi:methionine-rich copper-binding protein CopC
MELYNIMKKIFQITIILLLLLCTISAVSADNLENSSNMDKSNSDISSYEKINLEDTEDLNSNMPIREISDKDSKYFHDENFKDNSFSNYEKDNNTSKNIKIKLEMKRNII